MQTIEETLAEVDDNCSTIRVSGSTVACALIRPSPLGDFKRLFVANLGDSRVVLAKSDGSAERLTYDHTAEDAQEQARIAAVGGFMLHGRILGILSVARAIGDHTMKKYISHVPYTRTFDITSEHDFLIIACDGVWDVLKDEEAVTFVREGLKTAKFTRENAAERLLNHALENGTQDNVTVLVVFL